MLQFTDRLPRAVPSHISTCPKSRICIIPTLHGCLSVNSIDFRTYLRQIEARYHRFMYSLILTQHRSTRCAQSGRIGRILLRLRLDILAVVTCLAYFRGVVADSAFWGVLIISASSGLSRHPENSTHPIHSHAMEGCLFSTVTRR